MELKEKLELPIPEYAKFTRRGGAGDLTYVDGAYVIDSLNEVFGHTGWEWTRDDHALVSMTQVEDGKAKGKWMCLATYCGTLTVHGGPEGTIHKAGEAAGSGTSFNPNEAIHFALTEAATDALKRAARLFGGRMGLELYRKKGNLAKVFDPSEASDAFLMFAEAISKLHDKSGVPALANEIKAHDGLSDDELDQLRVQMRTKMESL